MKPLPLHVPPIMKDSLFRSNLYIQSITGNTPTPAERVDNLSANNRKVFYTADTSSLCAGCRAPESTLLASTPFVIPEPSC